MNRDEAMRQSLAACSTPEQAAKVVLLWFWGDLFVEILTPRPRRRWLPWRRTA